MKVIVDGRTDGHLRPTLLGRLGGVDLKISKKISKKRRDRRDSKPSNANKVTNLTLLIQVTVQWILAILPDMPGLTSDPSDPISSYRVTQNFSYHSFSSAIFSSDTKI